MYGQQNIKISA